MLNDDISLNQLSSDLGSFGYMIYQKPKTYEHSILRIQAKLSSKLISID